MAHWELKKEKRMSDERYRWGKKIVEKKTKQEKSKSKIKKKKRKEWEMYVKKMYDVVEIMGGRCEGKTRG